MLKFIVGPPASGKTCYAVSLMKELSQKGEESVLIVPEQFTFENERMILKALGDSFSQHTSVLSFSRLCDEVGRISGGIAATVLTDADKIVFMSRALKNVRHQLKLWGRFASSVTFAKTLLDTVGEFKINAVSCEELLSVTENISRPTLKAKILDLVCIYKEYNNLLGERFIDPADKLTKLYLALENVRFFKDKTVILDSFKGWTGQQFLLIERILTQAKDVYICLTDRTDVQRNYDIFTNIREAARRITNYAASRGIEVSDPLILTESYYNSEGLCELEKLLSAGNCEKTCDDSVTLVACDSLEDQAEFAARTIHSLVRKEGLRFRDFVVIARDSEPYETAIQSAFKKNNVPVFFDKRVPLSSFSAAIAVDAAIKALDFDTDNILRFHKTGLGNLSPEEISKLQNYCFIWNIKGDVWNKEWDMNPSGFSADERFFKNNAEELKELNNLRIKAIKPINNLKNSFYGSAKRRVRAIVNLMDECAFAEKLTELSKIFEEKQSLSVVGTLRQSYDEYIHLLDCIVRCFGEEPIAEAEFYDALKLSVGNASVGVVPQMLDEVTFGSADRIRPSRPKVAIILGMNQGEFPKNVGSDSVFSVRDRAMLLEKGITIADNSVYSAIDEEYLVYSNLCCPSDKVYICYAVSTTTGEELTPSALLGSIEEKLGARVLREPQNDISISNIPETPDAAWSEYCRRNAVTKDAATLKRIVDNSGNGEKADYIFGTKNGLEQKISPEAAEQLFGKNIRMTASKFNTFSQCRFAYFCKYGLNVDTLQSADFNVMQRGTIIHYVLECIINDYKEDIDSLKTADYDLLTDKYIAQYLDSVPGYRSVENSMSRWLVERISRSLKEVVSHICKEIIQSDFKPVACELKIDKDGDIPPIKFPYGKGVITITGSIDRVDRYGEKIRIIDYKSGKRTFALSDILFGLNLQMLIYLYAVIRGDGREDRSAAGILYQPVHRDLKGKGIAMNGLICEDREMAYAMDKSGEGVFVPKLVYTQKGELSANCESYIKSEDFSVIFDHIENLMSKAGESISSGDFSAIPVKGNGSLICNYCEFKDICGITEDKVVQVAKLKNREVLEIIREGDGHED